ncbi:peptidoglycan DD-metalloendopeptidase family protein [Bradyrhizobium oropedii]|uniref:M23 family metallopeptidase n=1 Tax=Bradyrhizobium oropedii TaxID=1571201 RepID=UPI003B846D28
MHSPVSGVVTRAGSGKTNTIAIRDYTRNSHEILHTQSQSVEEGQKVFAGDLIGTMGNVGTKDQHAHYQICGPNDPNRRNPINPHVFWNHPFCADQRSVFDPRSLALRPDSVPSDSDFASRFDASGRHMPGSTPSSHPRYDTQSFSVPPDDVSREETSKRTAVRRLVRVPVTGEDQTVFDAGAPAMPFVASTSIAPPGRPATFNERFPASPPPAGTPSASMRSPAPFNGQPMRYLSPSVFGIPDNSVVSETESNDWLAGLMRPRPRQ